MTEPAEPPPLRALGRFLRRQGRNRAQAGTGWERPGELGFQWWFDPTIGRWNLGATPKAYAAQWYDADLWRAWLEGKDAPDELRPLRQQARFFIRNLRRLEKRLKVEGRDVTIAGVGRVLSKRRFQWPAEVTSLLDDCFRRGFDVVRRSSTDPLNWYSFPFIELAGGDPARLLVLVHGGRDHQVAVNPVVLDSSQSRDGLPSSTWRTWLDETPNKQPPFDPRAKVEFDDEKWERAWREDAEFFRKRLPNMIAKVAESGQEKSWKHLVAIREAERSAYWARYDEATPRKAVKK